MPKYVDKWIAIGTSTEPLDPDRTQEIVNKFRGLIERKTDVPLIIVNNPIEAWVGCCLSEQDVKPEDIVEGINEVLTNNNPKDYEIPQGFLPWASGSFFASTFSFYDYIFDVLGVRLEDELYEKYKIWQDTSEIGCVYPLEELTIVCEKPTEINLNEDRVLHKDGGAALTYAGHGDFKVYSLNGVTVPEWLAVTPAEEIELERYNEIENADIKAEFVRKVDIERFINKGKLIDTYEKYDKKQHDWWHKSEYELYDMAFLFDGLDTAPFLSMVNQTTKIFHLEGVSPQCQSLEAAVKERFGGRDFKIRDIA